MTPTVFFLILASVLLHAGWHHMAALRAAQEAPKQIKVVMGLLGVYRFDMVQFGPFRFGQIRLTVIWIAAILPVVHGIMQQLR